MLDVDEFIVLPPGCSLADFLAGVQKPRMRLTSFNMDTTGWDSQGSLLEHVSQRWAYEDALPLHTVHAINRGPFERAEIQQARVLHFKYPPLDILPYPVQDWGALEAWQAGEAAR